MARPIHPAAPGQFQHLVVNAPDGQRLFRDDEDKYRFMKDFAKTRERMDVTCLSVGIVDTHVHVGLASGLVHSTSAFMHQLLTSYCCKFNLKYEHRGHVLRSRHFWLLMSDAHALNAFRYMILNPLKCGLVRTMSHLEHYPFTILPELLGHRLPQLASLDETLAIFGDTEEEARTTIRAWLRGGLEDPTVFRALEALFRRRRSLANLVTEPIDVDAEFAAIVARVSAMANLGEAELSSRDRRPVLMEARAAVVHLAMTQLAMTRAECAKRLGCSATAISRLVVRGEAAATAIGLAGTVAVPPGLLARMARFRSSEESESPASPPAAPRAESPVSP